MTRTHLLTALASLLIGLAIGYTVAGPGVVAQSAAPVAGRPAEPANHSADERVASLQRQLDQAASENAELAGKLSFQQTSALGSLADSTYKVSKKLLSDFRVTLFAGDEITPDAADFLHLNPAEIKAVNGSLQSLQGRLKELQIEHERLVRQTPGSVTVAVQPFPEEGKQLHEQLASEIQNSLGEERSQLFMNLMDQEQSTWMGRLGDGTTQITITNLGTGKGYRIHDEYKTGNSSQATEVNESSIPPEMSYLFDSSGSAPVQGTATGNP